jgi:DGQHR domain-containing protein
MIMIPEDKREIELPVLKIRQPIGEIYVGSISSEKLYEIAHFDVRRIDKEGGFDRYLGLQRELDKKRVKTIQQYVKGLDASFPTSVVLAVDEQCVRLTQPCEEAPEFFRMTLSNYGEPDEETGERAQVSMYRSIARVIDGQHRIAGLDGYVGPPFELNVSLFVGADLPDQAAVFSAVNLTQTKVNRSLAYDLYELSHSRSPERTAHIVAVSLDRIEESPFHRKIMRLGKATPGRVNETFSQAVIVNSILDYISGTQERVLADRQTGRKVGRWSAPPEDEARRLIFRTHFVDDRDTDIAKVMLNYFGAVRQRWPDAWNILSPGIMLNRTNGYMGLMRFLRPAFNHLGRPGAVVDQDAFFAVFKQVGLERDDFNTENFIPGSSGASKLYRVLLEQAGLSE